MTRNQRVKHLLKPTHVVRSGGVQRFRSTCSSTELHIPKIVTDTGRNVRYAKPGDLSYIYHLQNVLNHSVGHAPRGALQDRIDTARIIVIEENDHVAGFLNFTHRQDQVTHISQVAVDPEIWRNAAGSAIMQVIIQSAKDAGSKALTLKSALDLDANQFWPTLGFIPQGLIQGKRRWLSAWTRIISADIAYPIQTPTSGGHPAKFLTLRHSDNPSTIRTSI